MSQILWNSKDADQATGFKSTLPWQAMGVSIDTRTIKPGDLFIALKGDNHDGHHFLNEAISRGAAALLIDKIPDNLQIPIPYLKVKDTFESLHALASFKRQQTKAKIIAVTGSVGKTSTKEALYIAFSAVSQCIASQGGLNNHWGLPLSLARIPDSVDFAILEMGMNHKGEIHTLSQMAQPHLTIITTVAEVHQEFFKSIDEIAEAKCEIFDGLMPAGIIVLNRDCSTFDLQYKLAKKQKEARIITFGSHVEADVRLLKITMTAAQCEILVQIFGKPLSYNLNTRARHLAYNSMAVLASIAAFDLDVEKAAESLLKFSPLSGRGKQELIHFKEGSFLLIDESYNASPIAVKAALNVLGASATGNNGRRIFVFGDMKELGDHAHKFHEDLADTIIQENIDVVYSCGTLSKSLYEAIPTSKRGAHKDNSQELAEILPQIIKPGDVVMVKGSLSMQMKRVVDSLKGLRGDL